MNPFKLSRNTLLLNNGGRLPEIPLELAVGMKESYANMEALVVLINYNCF